MLFTYDSYEKLLREIKDQYKYSFLRFDHQLLENTDRLLYLRHDVDISPYSALQLGKIEHKLDITANYFFQIGAETYNLFSSNTIQIIKDLFSMGHCVGLHIDEVLFRDNGEKIFSTLKWFKECITDVNLVVSFHRPSNSMLHRKFNSFISAYQTDFFSPENFLSDSRKNEEFYPKLMKLLNENRSPIQLLLHPAWWYPEKDVIKFKDKIVKRRISELNKYLKSNFKNLERHIEDEDHTYGL